MLISERIYQYLEEKGMSQIEFVKRTGISQSTVSDWRRKGTNPSADKIMIICDVLEISPYELLLETDSKNPKEHRQMDYVVINKNSKEYEEYSPKIKSFSNIEFLIPLSFFSNCLMHHQYCMFHRILIIIFP